MAHICPRAGAPPTHGPEKQHFWGMSQKSDNQVFLGKRAKQGYWRELHFKVPALCPGRLGYISVQEIRAARASHSLVWGWLPGGPPSAWGGPFSPYLPLQDLGK